MTTPPPYTSLGWAGVECGVHECLIGHGMGSVEQVAAFCEGDWFRLATLGGMTPERAEHVREQVEFYLSQPEG